LTVEEVKKYFMQAFRIEAIAKARKAQLEELREKRLLISSLTYGEKVKTTPNFEKFNQLSDLYIQREGECLNDLIRLEKIKIEYAAHISKLTKHTHEQVMSERYIMLKKWADVAKAANYSLSRVHEIHIEALEEIKEWIEVDYQTVL